MCWGYWWFCVIVGGNLCVYVVWIGGVVGVFEYFVELFLVILIVFEGS